MKRGSVKREGAGEGAGEGEGEVPVVIPQARHNRTWARRPQLASQPGSGLVGLVGQVVQLQRL